MMQLKDISPKKIEETVREFANLGTIRELKGITHEEMETIYSVGLSYYRTGRYEQAEKLFRFLTFFDHVSSKYWTALAGVYQVTRRYPEAIQAYQFAVFLDIHNARAFYYLAQCQVAFKQNESAIGTIALFEEAGAADEIQRGYLEKAKALRAQLEAAEAAKGSKKGV